MIHVPSHRSATLPTRSPPPTYRERDATNATIAIPRHAEQVAGVLPGTFLGVLPGTFLVVPVGSLEEVNTVRLRNQPGCPTWTLQLEVSR
jgi:hypothetical protein